MRMQETSDTVIMNVDRTKRVRKTKFILFLLSINVINQFIGKMILREHQWTCTLYIDVKFCTLNK